jgi:hypothetical protein
MPRIKAKPSGLAATHTTSKRKALAAPKPKAAPKLKADPVQVKLAQKLAKDMMKAMPVMHAPIFQMDTPEGTKEAAAYTEQYGFSVCNVHASESERIKFGNDLITQVWNTNVADMVLKPAKAILVKTITDAQSLGWFAGDLPKWLLKELRDALGTNLYLHCGFGASATNASFNIPVAWKLRQHELLANFAAYVLGTDDVKCSMDRSISKFNGQGDEAWLHLDRDKNSDPCLTQLHGKYCAVEANFICVPGSNNDHAEMKRLYGPMYENTHGDKWALDPTKPDPLNFFGRARKVVVPAGCIVWWKTDTVHGVLKNDTKAVKWGVYVGFETDVEREGYFKKSGKHEVQDRYDVWSKGIAPKLHPSLDKVQLYPKRFQNYHGILGDFITRMDPNSQQYDYSYRKLKRKGPEKWVPHLVENPPVNYIPPVLTRRGQELLVGKNRVVEYFGEA